MVTQLAIAGIMITFYACADALQDAITFHFENSILSNFNPKYFNPAISWKNKYKDGTYEPRFFGSTTFLVWVTDFWHLLKFIKMNTMCIAIAVALSQWYMYFLAMILWGVCFEVFYEHSK